MKIFFFLFFSLLIQDSYAFTIFKYDKEKWQVFREFAPLKIKQSFIVSKENGGVGAILEEVSTNQSETLVDRCKKIKTSFIDQKNYCKITKKGEVYFLFEKNFQTAKYYQLVFFKNQASETIAEFERGLK